MMKPVRMVCVCVCVCVFVCVCVSVCVCAVPKLKPESITLHHSSDPIEVVSSFEYLGSTISEDYSLNAEVEAHISKASRAFNSLSRVLWYQRRGKRQTKIRLFNSVIVSVLMYGL